MKDSKAQTTFEYLVILGVVMALLAGVVYLLKVTTPSERFTEVVNQTINKTR